MLVHRRVTPKASSLKTGRYSFIHLGGERHCESKVLIRNSTQTAVTIKHDMTIKPTCVLLSCLSLQFVYYFLLSYDGQRERIFE